MQAAAPLSHRLLSTATAAWLMLEASASASPGEQLDLVIESPEQPPLISSGTPAHNCQWPTTVMLDDGEEMCSGTLVHPQIVTTAGHCPHPDKIVFGESAWYSKREVRVDHCKRNPAYSEDDHNGVNGNDFAYCKLAHPVYDIPITPPVYGCELEILSANRPAIIVGFGNNHGDTGAGTKRWTATTIQTLVDETSTMVMVGSAGNAACSGDSGGPAFVQYPDGSWHAFGITSGGPPCGTGPDVYSLIHRAVPWIEESSGVDITPCHDVDGTWNPTPECQGFAVETLDTSVQWNHWCETPRLGPAVTCGQAFNAGPDGIAPIVHITAPEDRTTFQGTKATIDIDIDASDQGHGVKSVTLEVDGKVVATDEHAPWVFANALFPKGDWTLVAVAEDWNGNVTASTPIEIGVGQDPLAEPMGEAQDERDLAGDVEIPSPDHIDEDDDLGCGITDQGSAPMSLVLGLLGVAVLRRRSFKPTAAARPAAATR
jgi:hypothetical protein